MKKIILVLLLYFSFVSLCLGGDKIIELRLSGNLVDSKGTLATGEMVRTTTATYINGGILYTAAIDTARFEDGWLLIEGAGTNFLTHSEDFSSWDVGNAPTLTSGQDDPAGGTSAYLLEDDSVADTEFIWTNTLPFTLIGTEITYSVFLKKGTCSESAIRLRDKTVGSTKATGVVDWTASPPTISAPTASGGGTITQLGSTDWYRIAIREGGLTNGNDFIVYLYGAGEITTNIGTVYIYGAQCEATLYLTSYISTDGAAVTRTTEAGSAGNNGVSWTITQPLKNLLDDSEPAGGPTDSQGTLLFEVKWKCNESDFTGGTTYGLITSTDSRTILAYHSDFLFVTNEGIASSAVSHPSFLTDETLYYVARWGDVDGNANNLSAGLKRGEGSWTFDATPANYDGAFTLGTDLRLNFTNPHPLLIRNIKFYDVAYTQAEIIAGVEKGLLLWSVPLEIP